MKQEPCSGRELISLNQKGVGCGLGGNTKMATDYSTECFGMGIGKLKPTGMLTRPATDLSQKASLYAIAVTFHFVSDPTTYFLGRIWITIATHALRADIEKESK